MAAYHHQSRAQLPLHPPESDQNHHRGHEPRQCSQVETATDAQNSGRKTAVGSTSCGPEAKIGSEGRAEEAVQYMCAPYICLKDE